MSNLPVIDLHQPKEIVANSIHDACRQFGFFYIKNHDIDIKLQNDLANLATDFFRLSMEEKMRISMDKGGSAWRGFFPVGNELTSGKPDQKEGIYFGGELDDSHPLVKAGTPLHGKNLFPENPASFKEVVLDYMQSMENLGHKLMELIALSLKLDGQYFEQHYTKRPFPLFRIFHYPAGGESNHQGVGEHTDYGLLTILKQDNIGGLEVKVDGNWIAAPPIENTFVCNIGDMLERITGGYYLSTPHRVLNTSKNSRYSFPYFFDPAFDANVQTIPAYKQYKNQTSMRWDNKSVFDFKGSYGVYLISKVSKVFPELKERTI